MAGPSQFLSDRLKRGILCGYGVRVLHYSVGSAESVLNQLRRVAVEFDAAGFPHDMIQRSFARLDRMANVDVLPALDVLQMPPGGRSVWRSLYDLMAGSGSKREVGRVKCRAQLAPFLQSNV